LAIHIIDGAPHGSYTLSVLSGSVEVTGPTYQDEMGSEVDFPVHATDAGSVELALHVFYTIDLSSSAYCYSGRYQTVESPPYSFTVLAAAPSSVACFGDCDSDGAVTIDELITLVNVALGSATLNACPGTADDPCYDLPIFVDCVIKAVNNALFGCPGTPPTPTPTPSPTEAVSVPGCCTFVDIAGCATSRDSGEFLRNCAPHHIGGFFAGFVCNADTSKCEPSSSATPPTPTPSPTPAPIPTGAIRYRILAGGHGPSSIAVFSAGPPPTPSSFLEDLLSGTFVALPSEPDGSGAPSHFTITDIALQGSDHTVTGEGHISMFPTPEEVTMALTASINGQQVEMSGAQPLAVLSDDYPPTFVGLQACGAPGRIVTCESLFEGADSGYWLSVFAVPEATQTPLPTRTPFMVRYRLTEGSSVTYSPPTPGPSPSIVEEPLSGTFDVVAVEPTQGNTVSAFSITSVEFQSVDFTIMGNMGSITVLALYQDGALETGLTVSINGQQVSLSGDTTATGHVTSYYPPFFSAVEVSGNGYSLTLFAVPE
jgi:uncharacterized Zn-binding protein involved in type VI secretion